MCLYQIFVEFVLVWAVGLMCTHKKNAFHFFYLIDFIFAFLLICHSIFTGRPDFKHGWKHILLQGKNVNTPHIKPQGSHQSSTIAKALTSYF